jgi:hypothetical protein
VSGLRRGERDFHRLAIPDFTHENNLRRLTQRRPKAGGKVGKITPKFALGKSCFEMRMEELDRILERHHMNLRGHIQLVQHRRERRRLARARGTGDENDPRLFLHDLAAKRRQFQRVDRGNLRIEFPHHDCVIAVLPENVHAEAGDVWHRVTRVARAVVFQIGLHPLVVAHQLPGDPLRVLRLEHRHKRGHIHAAQFSIDLHLRRPADDEKQIGDAVTCFKHVGQHGIE